MTAGNRFAALLLALPVCLLLCLPVGAQTAPPVSKSSSAILPVNARTEAIVFEKDLTALCHRIGVKLGSVSAKSPVVASASASPPVSRLRVIAALVKLMVAPDSLEAYKTELPDGMPEDQGMIPEDVMPYVAAAVSEGWVTTEPLKGRQTATWGFVRALLARIPTLGVAPEKSKAAPKLARDEKPASETASSEEVSDEKFSGLIVDVGGMKIERSMSPRILDADGQVVYPDVAHVPDPDTVLDKGILDYTPAIEKSKRAGDKPLVVKATKIDFKDVYVSNEDAALIRKANKRAKFIETWQVCIVSGN